MLSSVVVSDTPIKDAPFLLSSGDLLGDFRRVREIGFQGVELQTADPWRHGEALLRACRGMDLKITSLASGLACREGLCLTAADEVICRKTMDRLKQFIRFAEACGAGSVVHIGLIRGWISNCGSKAQYLDVLAGRMRELAEYAGRHGVMLALEPLNHRDSDGLNTWEETADFLAQLGHPAVKISVDLYHMRMEEPDLLLALRTYADQIGIVQLMDDNRWYPGAGLLRFERIIPAILDGGYDGPVVIECLPLPDAETAMIRALDFYQTMLEGRKPRGYFKD